MAFNPFLGPAWNKAKLEAALSDAQNELAAGAVTISAGAGEANGAFSKQLSIERRIELLYKALNALDSTTYPLDSISRVDRTKANMSGIAPPGTIVS